MSTASINIEGKQPDTPASTVAMKIAKGIKDIFKATLSMGQYLKDPAFFFFILAVVFLHFGHLVPYQFIPLRLVRRGTSKEKAAFLISLCGIGTAAGRLLWGWCGDLSFVNRKLQFAIA